MKNIYEQLNDDLVHVFVAQIPELLSPFEILPEERKREIDGIANEGVKRQKIAVWRLLQIALDGTYALSIENARLKKVGDKWQGEGFFLSLSHSQNLVAVSLSRCPVGVDIEQESVFATKLKRVGEEAFLSKICSPDEKVKDLTPIEIWTRKESLFKLSNGKAFIPAKINCDNSCAVTLHGFVEKIDFCLSFATPTPAPYTLKIVGLDEPNPPD